MRLKSVEMRHSVTTPIYILRRAVDNLLASLSSPKGVTTSSLGPLLARVPFPSRNPTGWLPLYTMVTFRPDISYATAQRKATEQSRLLTNAGWSVVLGTATVGLTWMALFHRTRSQT